MSGETLFSIQVLGAFDVTDVHGRSVRPSGRKDCALVAVLALTRGHRQTRTWLQDKLWGERGPAQGAASLRQSLNSLRAVFNRGAEIVCTDRTWVWLEPRHLSFDHEMPGAQGEVLRGFDLREEGFNEWLREARSEFAARDARPGLLDVPAQADRRWYLDPQGCGTREVAVREVSDLVCDGIVDALSTIGLGALIDCRLVALTPSTTPPRATDMIVRPRVIRFGRGCIVSVTVYDGFGSLRWQVRRELQSMRWPSLRDLEFEIAHLIQAFAMRTEATPCATSAGVRTPMAVRRSWEFSCRERCPCARSCDAAKLPSQRTRRGCTTLSSGSHISSCTANGRRCRSRTPRK